MSAFSRWSGKEGYIGYVSNSMPGVGKPVVGGQKLEKWMWEKGGKKCEVRSMKIKKV